LGVGIIFVAVWLPILVYSIAHWNTVPIAMVLSIIMLVVFGLFMGLFHESK